MIGTAVYFSKTSVCEKPRRAHRSVADNVKRADDCKRLQVRIRTADMLANAVKMRRAGLDDVDTIQRISADAYIPAYMAVPRSQPPRITAHALRGARFGF